MITLVRAAFNGDVFCREIDATSSAIGEHPCETVALAFVVAFFFSRVFFGG